MPATAKHMPHRASLGLLSAAIGLVMLLLALPTSAGAADANRANLNLLPPVEKRLDVKNARVISTGLARGRGKAVRMPVTGGKVGARTAQLKLGGGFKLKTRIQGRRARVLRIARLQLQIGKRSVLKARLGRDRKVRPAFILRHGPKALRLSPDTKQVKLVNARLVPTGATKRALRQSLGVKRVRTLPLARLALSADLTAFELPPVAPPPLQPLPPEPEKLARPAGAVDVTNAQVTWCARASWVRYIGNGILSGGATSEPAFIVNDNATDFARVCDRQQKNLKPTSDPTAYKYFFPFKEGWYDAASNTAALYFTGTVTFRYPDRGIDLDFSDLEVEFNGAQTRTIFRITGRGDSVIPPTRVLFATNGDPVPSLTTGLDGSLTSGELPSFLPEATTVGVFAGNYMSPNNDFGWFSVEFMPAT